jgi:hypothetical protein
MNETGVFTVLTGRTNYFLGSGYNSDIRVAIRPEYLVVLLNKFSSVVPSRQTVHNSIQLLLVEFEEHLLAMPLDRRLFEQRYIEHTASYFTQFRELRQAQIAATTSNKTRSSLSDLDFHQRGPGAAFGMFRRTGGGPPSLKI